MKEGYCRKKERTTKVRTTKEKKEKNKSPQKYVFQEVLLLSRRTWSLKTCGSARRVLSNVRRVFTFLFASSGLRLETLLWISFLPSDLIWSKPSAACGSFDVALSAASWQIKCDVYCFQMFLSSPAVFILGRIVPSLCKATMPLRSCMGIRYSAFSCFTFLRKSLKAGRKLPGGYTHFTSCVCGVGAPWVMLIMGKKNRTASDDPVTELTARSDVLFFFPTLITQL